MRTKANGNRHTILIHKLIFTIIIVLVYLLGRSLPLFGLNISVDMKLDIDVQTLMMQTISGDRHQNSMFTLGIFPYMIATLIIQIVMSTLSSDKKSRVSTVILNRVSLSIMLIIALIQAYLKSRELHYRASEISIYVVQLIVILEMVAGAFVIMWLSTRNAKYGIGGQTTLIYINILDSLTMTLQSNPISRAVIPLAISVVVIVVVVVMENAEKRIPVQRVAIHSIYADKNYMAIKLNPIGVMPVMFSSAVFMLLQIIMEYLTYIFPKADALLWVHHNMVLNNLFGIIVYIMVLYFLTIMMSFVFINPRDLTEQFLKSGDSIVNIHAGEDTRRYLKNNVLTLSIISATVMGICILVPMLLEYFGVISSSLAVIPSSFMMLTGIFHNLRQEVIAVRNFDEYRPFI